MKDLRILVAEDSATQREQLCSILARWGCELEVTTNGREALAAATARPPDMLITDVIMPEMTGYELCSTLKNDSRFSRTLVVLVTSLSDPADVVRGLECGADNFILKPYDPRDLHRRLTDMVSNSRVEAGNPDLPVEITFVGQKFVIRSSRRQILNLLLTTYDAAVQRNSALLQAQRELRILADSLEQKVLERTAKLEAEVEERSRADAALQQQTDILQSVVRSMGDGLVVTDCDGRWVLVNPSACKLLGLESHDPLPETRPEACAVFYPDRVTPFPPRELPSARALRGESCAPMEFWLRTVKGDGIFISATANPIVDSRGRVRGGVVVMRDVTGQKQMEIQMLRTQRMESIGTLAGGVAHDLNNVLSPIVMASDLLLMREDPASEGHLRIIHKSARRGAELVKQLLTFARGSDDEERMPLPIYVVVRELVHVVQDTFPKHIEVRADLEKELWFVTGDATQIDQVLLNLCVNARDAMPGGGTLVVKARNVMLDELEVSAHPDARPGSYVMVSVADNGSGIPQEILDRMFEPFFTTKERGKGTGLGLSTVLGIVRGHGGFIDVQSRPGQGTTFTVYFPADPHETAADVPATALDIPHGNGELILIADDEEAIRETVATMLERHGYRVIKAEDGAAATAAFAQQHDEVAVVIVDMTMPVMDGLSTVRVLRKINDKARIVLSSGLKDHLDSEAIASHAIDGVLRKPYKRETLISTVHEALQGCTRR